MPERKIPKNYRNVTGIAASDKAVGSAGFESTLERDLLQILEFDIYVDRLEVQPVQIHWADSNGKSRIYTPDVFVQYRRDIAPAKHMRHLLCEVKYREDLRKNWADLYPKFRAAIRYAKERDWRFKIFTENEIRSDYLGNAKFLLPFKQHPANEDYQRLLLDRLQEMREADPDSLTKAIFQDRWKRAELLPTLWHLIAIRRIGMDLGLPLTMATRIWSRERIA